MTSTLGAPAGGCSGSIGGNFASGSFASKGNAPSYRRSGIGSTSLWIWEGLNSYHPFRATFCETWTTVELTTGRPPSHRHVGLPSPLG
jgi:hypothetical protein